MNTKPWYTSRTLYLMAATFLSGVLALPEIQAIVPLSWMPYLTALGAALGFFLRFRTNQPLSAIFPELPEVKE